MKRAQRKRTKGWRKPPNSRYVGRGTKWGNPHRVTRRGRWYYVDGDDPFSYYENEGYAVMRSIQMYAEHARKMLRLDRHWLDELFNYDFLLCWCELNDLCHADVLIEMIMAMQRASDE
jgi:hypothetical protein